MEQTISKKQAWLKQVRLTKNDNLYVGIEAHKKSLHVAFFLNDAPAIDFVLPPDEQKRLVQNIARSLRKVSKEIQKKTVEHFRKADKEYGEGVEKAL